MASVDGLVAAVVLKELISIRRSWYENAVLTATLLTQALTPAQLPPVAGGGIELVVGGADEVLDGDELTVVGGGGGALEPP